MNNKRNLIIALLFVAVLSACIIITIKENNALVSSSSRSALSSSTSQSSSSAVLSSTNITAASSLNNTDVERYLKKFKENNKNGQFFDFALSTYPFSENMIEAAASYYYDKNNPKPMVVVMSQYGLLEYNLRDEPGDYAFAEEGKVKIIGKNELIISIINKKTKEIFDCDVTYSCINHGQSSSGNMHPIKRSSSSSPTI